MYLNQIQPRNNLGFWPFSRKTDQEKAQEALDKVKGAFANFQAAHEIVKRLYAAGLLSDKLKKAHKKLRDDLGKMLAKMINTLSPEDYLTVHNYLVTADEEIGLGIVWFIPIGIAIAIAALSVTAVSLYNNSVAHRQDAENEAKKVGLVEKGLAPADVLNKPEDKSKGFIEGLIGINPAYLVAAAGALYFSPQIIEAAKRMLKK